MYLLSRNESNSISSFSEISDMKDIRNKLDLIYEKSPSSSSISISTNVEECGLHKLNIEIISLREKFYYVGKKSCLREAFYEGIDSLQEQLLLWNKNRFSNNYLTVRSKQ